MVRGTQLCSFGEERFLYIWEGVGEASQTQGMRRTVSEFTVEVALDICIFLRQIRNSMSGEKDGALY